MIFELASVHDRGTLWSVDYVTKNTLDSLANRDSKFLKLSYVAYKMIYDAINQNKRVFIQKELKTDEVLPNEVIIKDIDVNDISLYRNSSFAKIKNLTNSEVANISAFTIYGFTVLNNELISKGFPIYEENRQEMYIKIIETGDDLLISKLEEYLEYVDLIERSSALYKRVKEYGELINSLDTPEEINKAEESFLTKIYSTSS